MFLRTFLLFFFLGLPGLPCIKRHYLSAWKLLFVFLLLVGVCQAQGVQYTRKEAGDGGTAVPYPLVTVCTSGAAYTPLPCTPKASIYSDAALSVPLANPFRGDPFGNIEFYAPAGTYIVSVTDPYSPGYSFKIVLSNPLGDGRFIVGAGPGQYASLQAAHDALPSTGGTIFVMATGTPFGATALAATKPMHVIFDCANFTYSGAAAQAISSTSRGVIIEGCGRRGDDVGTSGTTITITNTATNGISNSGGGATFRDFNLIGPASGTGKGVINTSGRATYSNLNISSFGGDGWTNDGSATNANTVLVQKVRASSNGGNGFVTKGTNGQLVTFIECDGSLNTGDGWNIANQLNVFQGTNADGNTGYDYHFVSGGTGNTGNIFSNNAGAGPPGGIQFDAGANSNVFTQMGSGGTLAVTSGLGTNNMVWSQAQTTYTSGNNNMTLGLSSGTGAGIRGATINFQDNNTNKWAIQKTASNLFSINNPGVLDMILLNPGSAVQLASGGSQDVRVNDQALAATGTGGFSVWSGGASSAKTSQMTGGGMIVDVNAVTPCTNGELALSANWGNTGAPTVTAVAGTGQTCQWTITAGGAATGASPTITDTLTNALPTATTVCDMRMVGGTGAATLINQTSLSATAPIFTFNGTPGAGLTYIVVRRCGP